MNNKEIRAEIERLNRQLADVEIEIWRLEDRRDLLNEALSKLEASLDETATETDETLVPRWMESKIDPKVALERWNSGKPMAVQS